MTQCSGETDDDTESEGDEATKLKQNLAVQEQSYYSINAKVWMDGCFLLNYTRTAVRI